MSFSPDVDVQAAVNAQLAALGLFPLSAQNTCGNFDSKTIQVSGSPLPVISLYPSYSPTYPSAIGGNFDNWKFTVVFLDGIFPHFCRIYTFSAGTPALRVTMASIGDVFTIPGGTGGDGIWLTGSDPGDYPITLQICPPGS